MNVLAHFNKLLNLPISMVNQEAQHKFCDTYMNLNGYCVRIVDIDSDNLVTCEDNDGGTNHWEGCDIDLLEVWMPDSGVYKINSQYVTLHRVGKKQWKKSFSWDQYECSGMNVLASNFFEKTPLDFYVKMKNLYFDDLIIAKIVGKKLTKINPCFQIECNQYKKDILNG